MNENFLSQYFEIRYICIYENGYMNNNHINYAYMNNGNDFINTEYGPPFVVNTNKKH